MTTYRLKRKTFGVIDAARNVVGGTVETAGDVASSGLGKTAGAIAGAAYAPSLFQSIGGAVGSAQGAAIGSTASTIGGSLGKVMGTIGGFSPLGMLAGAGLGWMGAKMAGKLLKKTGQSIQTE